MVDISDPVTNTTLSYYIEPRLHTYLHEKVKIDLSRKDKDYVMIIDGYEGSGKSTFAQQIGKYVDPTLDLSRICMTANEFKMAIINARPNQCVIYDEAVTGMTSSDSITRVGKLLKSMMMQMRQKNLFVIIIMPTIFEFGKYAVLGRAKSFFHVYESKGKRGYFAGYNRRDMKKLYLYGKKTYSYKVRSRFTGRFYGKYVVNEEEYRKKKADALFLIEGEDGEGEKGNKYMEFYHKLVIALRKELDLSEVKTAEKLKAYGIQVSAANIGEITRKYAVTPTT